MTAPGGAEPSTDGPAASRRRSVEPWLVRLLVISALSALAINAVRPMMSYRALALGASPVEVGLIAASFSLLSVAAALPIGRSIDRIGERRFIILGVSLTAVSTLAAVWIDTLPALALSQAAIGFGHTTTLIAGQTMVANRGGRTGRDERYGAYSTAVSVGQLLGPAIAGVLAGGALTGLLGITGRLPNEQAPAFLFAALTTAAGALLAATTLAQGDRPERVEEPSEGGLVSSVGRVLRRPGMPRAMLVSIIVVSSVDALVAYLPVYGQAHGLSVALVGGLLSLRAAASFTSRLFMGRLLARVGRRALLTASLVLAACGMAVISFVPPAWGLVVAAVLIGYGLGVGQPITIAWVANQSPRNERATALGLRLTGNRAALLVAPVAVGLVAGASGVTSVFGLMAAVIGAGALTAARTSFENAPREREAASDPIAKGDTA